MNGGQQEREEGGRPHAASILFDDHPELDSLTEDRAGLANPPPHLQDHDVSYVLEGFVKGVEKRMSAMVVPNYGGPDPSEQRPTIYMFPEEMRGTHEEDYLPVAVEIGLFGHHRKAGYVARDGHYGALEDYKWCCVRRLIGAGRHQQGRIRTPELLLRRCLSALKSLEPRIMAAYPRDMDRRNHGVRQDRLFDFEPWVGDGDGLPLRMLLDGCFVLHRLLKYARIARKEESASSSSSSLPSWLPLPAPREEEEEEDDDWTQLFGRCWVWGFVTCDLLLLENQIPFFVVQTLFEQLRTDADDDEATTTGDDVLVAGALRLFSSLRPRKLYPSPIPCRQTRVHHLLHLFYLSVGLPAAAAATPDAADPRKHAAAPPSELPQWIPCARELHEAGVKFRPRKGATSFLDVRFHSGVLEIPELQLHDYSEPLLRNLVAFEQTYPFTLGHVTAYAVFMDCLVDSPEDMRVLELGGVLVDHTSGGGGRDAAGFFGRLCAEAHLAADRNYLAGVIGEVNRYHRSRWPRWRTALVRNYFGNPWVAMSLAAAVVLLALTVLQSFFAAYAYFKPPKQR